MGGPHRAVNGLSAASGLCVAEPVGVGALAAVAIVGRGVLALFEHVAGDRKPLFVLRSGLAGRLLVDGVLVVHVRLPWLHSYNRRGGILFGRTAACRVPRDLV